MRFFNRQTVIIGIAALCIIIAHYVGALAPVERAATALFSPAARVLFAGGTLIAESYETAADQRSWRERYDEVIARNRELTAANAALQLLREENEALREQLQFRARYDYDTRSANVVSRSTAQSGTRFITLDIGSTDGVTVGQPVIAAAGLVVGKVTAVTGETAHACLLRDHNCHLAATVAESTATGGTTQGELGLTVRMDFVPREGAVSAGDTIVTSGLEPAVPPGLIIGTVQEVRQEANNLFQTAVIFPAAPDNARIVSVIVK